MGFGFGVLFGYYNMVCLVLVLQVACGFGDLVMGVWVWFIATCCGWICVFWVC